MIKTITYGDHEGT